MSLSQHLCDLFFRSVHAISVGDRRIDHIDLIVAANSFAPVQAILGRGEGDQDALVLIAETAAAPLLQNADDTEDKVVNPNRLINGVLAGFKEFSVGFHANHGHAPPFLNIAFGNKITQFRIPRAHILVAGCDATHRGTQALFAARYSGASAHFGRNRSNIWYLKWIANRIRIAEGQHAVRVSTPVGRTFAELTRHNKE